MRTLTANSPAKINLTLRVYPMRPDGYHPIESLVARVDLYDVVTIERLAGADIVIECDSPAIPTDESNFAARAARELALAANVPHPGLRIRLDKRIPVGAGLGGGSSNAATVLRMLNGLWGLNWPRPRLAETGARIGSDVPLFLHGPLAIMSGRGEHVRELDHRLTKHAVLILPGIECPTHEVYTAFDRLPPPPERPSPDDVLAKAGSGPDIMPHLFNDLEPAAFALHPRLAEIHTHVCGIVNGPVRMTGSGSTLFTLSDDPAIADDWAGRIRSETPPGVDAIATTLLL